MAATTHLNRLKRRLGSMARRAGAAPAPTPRPATVKESPLEEPRRLVEAGRFREAIEILTEINDRVQTSQVERRLMNARLAGGLAHVPGPLPEPWPPELDDPFPDVVGRPPEVAAADLDAATLGGGILHHGCLIVRGVLGDADCARAREVIDLAYASREEFFRTAKADRWYHPLHVEGRAEENGVIRGLVRTTGGTWMGDSPGGTAAVLEMLHRSGLVRAIQDHLGEEPCFSLQKSTLRRSEPEFRVVSWHQDGAFLDSGVRTVNVWVALTACGGDRPVPALEIVPQRVDHVLPPDGGELADYSLSGWAVHEYLDGDPTVIPEFEEGDAILFDELFLHRTHLTEGMTERRYALENWMFAPSSSSGGYDMLMV